MHQISVDGKMDKRKSGMGHQMAPRVYKKK